MSAGDPLETIGNYEKVLICFNDFSSFRFYVRGAKVRLRLHDPELSERFLGSSIDLTLLEASGTLYGLIWSPVKGWSPDGDDRRDLPSSTRLSSDPDDSREIRELPKPKKVDVVELFD